MQDIYYYESENQSQYKKTNDKLYLLDSIKKDRMLAKVKEINHALNGLLKEDIKEKIESSLEQSAWNVISMM